MKIHFVETEASEERFFHNGLSDHDLCFTPTLDGVSPETEILSTFIHSRIDAAFLDRHPALRLITTRSTGFDHLNAPLCQERGIALGLVPTYGENTVAEHTFALLLAISRRLREAMDHGRKRPFTYAALRGFDLHGKTLGVLGCGRIGLHTIRIAKAFGMEVLAFDQKPNPAMSEQLDFCYAPLEAVLSGADILSLHLPLTSETSHLLNRERLALCREGVVVINTSRGGLIDTEALMEALDSGQIAGVGLDVLEEESVLQRETLEIIGDQILSRLQASTAPAQEAPLSSNHERVAELQRLIRHQELISRANVVFTPHIAFNSREAVERINATTLRNITTFLESGAPLHPVPFVP